jgi:NTP pyrophosphatase (non-canonical NTP hydrolase)
VTDAGPASGPPDEPAVRPEPHGGPAGARPAQTLAGFQRAIEGTFFERDRNRGTAATFVWFVEEVGELARALKKGDRANLEEEFGDVLAWLSTLASLSGIELATAAEVYRDGCPTCHARPCRCAVRPLAI